MNNEILKFKTKYNFLDYWFAINYKFNKAIAELKSKKEYIIYFLFILLKPLLLLIISILASMTRLRKKYEFMISNDGFSQSINNKKVTIEWDRFKCYIETNRAIILQLDKEKKKGDGQVLIVKRVLTKPELEKLSNILEANKIFSGEIDLNMDI